MGFAQGTSVPIEKSRAEIERIVARYGADKFASGWDGARAMIQFTAHDRVVKFVLPLPSSDDAKSEFKKKGHTDSFATGARVSEWRTQEERRRWRSMLLAIKSKLEVVETGIETFEQAFLANIVTDNGYTVHERLFSGESRIKLLSPVG
jgi:hypothetical protein